MGHAQRVGKLCKYLPNETDWLPYIICGQLPIDLLPGKDDILARELPAEITVERVGGFLSSEVAQKIRAWKLYKPAAAFRKLMVLPDPYGDWVNRAVEKAEHIFPGGKGIECILASGPPNSVYLAGLRLAKSWQIPLVIDMRDPWSRSSTVRQINVPWHRKKIKQLQKDVYEAADAIIANTDGNALDLKRAYPQWASKIYVVPNGFDPDDIDPQKGPALRKGAEPGNTIHFLYLGGIRGRVGGGLFEGDFLQAVADYLVEYPQERSFLKLHFVGGTEPEVNALARHFGLQDICHAYGVVPTDAVGRPLAEADIYVLLLPPNRGDDRGWIPAKTYYYLAGGKYIFAIVPEGTARDLLRPLGDTVEIADPRDETGIKKALGRLIERVRSGPRTWSGGDVPDYAQPFNRRAIARQIGKILDNVCSGGHR
jgi:glycosyltransferase involved in cell wall biosynthesis